MENDSDIWDFFMLDYIIKEVSMYNLFSFSLRIFMFQLQVTVGQNVLAYVGISTKEL